MRKLVIILLFSVGITFGAEAYSLVFIPGITQNKTATLVENGFDIDHSINFRENRLELVVPRQKLQTLTNLGIKFQIEHNDLESFYASRLSTNSDRDFENGSMGGYYTFDEIVENLDELTNECPEIISEKFSIGQSLEGREIWSIRVSDNPNVDENEPEVLYTGLHHSREPMSYMNLMYYMNWLCDNYSIDSEIQNIVDNRELYFVPVVNPDGLIYNQTYAPNGGGLQRKNGLESCANNNNDDLWDGVDLNRNYGYYWGFDDEGSSPDGCSQTYRGNSPFSEPEIVAIKNFVEDHNFKIALNYHSYSNILIYPFGWEYNLVPPEEDFEIFIEFGAEMTQFNGYEMGTGPELLYPVNGEACDWMYGEHGIIAYTPEIGNFMDGFWPSTDRIVPLAEQNLHPNKFVAKAAGAMYESNISIGEGPYEIGETYNVDLFLKNKGLSNSSGDIIMTVESSWEILIENALINLNSLNSRQEIYLDQLFSFTVNPNAIGGELGQLTIVIQDDEGIEYNQTMNILIGVPLELVNQSFEVESNIDWDEGDDDASAGTWEWGVPNGTELNGVVIQPYTDHSEYGNSCFVTGNSAGNGNSGYDDVDGGSTSLYSPIYNLSDYSVAFVSYWRWFNNDMGDNPDNDKWIVEVTNNGGWTWTELENTSESVHDWVNKQFILTMPEFELTAMVRFRFIAQDLYYDGDNGNGGSLVEAALDDFEIAVFTESPILFGDVNNDHLVNIMDIITIINFILDISIPNENQAYIADFDQSGEINIIDVVGIVNLILALN